MNKTTIILAFFSIFLIFKAPIILSTLFRSTVKPIPLKSSRTPGQHLDPLLKKDDKVYVNDVTTGTSKAEVISILGKPANEGVVGVKSFMSWNEGTHVDFESGLVSNVMGCVVSQQHRSLIKVDDGPDTVKNALGC